MRRALYIAAMVGVGCQTPTIGAPMPCTLVEENLAVLETMRSFKRGDLYPELRVWVREANAKCAGDRKLAHRIEQEKKERPWYAPLLFWRK